MEFRPLGKRVLLKRSEVETTTKTGIVLPSSNEAQKPSYGIIKSISSEINNSNLTVGATVYFKEYKANQIKVDNQEYLVVELDDILGVLYK